MAFRCANVFKTFYQPNAKLRSASRLFHLSQDNAGKSEKISSLKNSDIWSRITVVQDEVESLKTVNSLMNRGQPIALDVEGLNLPTIGLIQIKSSDGQIYLFRTGRNKQLLTSGGLKTLLEDSNILKVIHASSSDCLAIYKEGIYMWGLYDTSIAHKVIEYQNQGLSINNNTISFSGLCAAYGFDDNPLKQYLGNQMHQREIVFSDFEKLPTDVLLYSAADVEPLLDIYDITQSLIQPDFLPLFHELCENELIRFVDPELLKRRQSERKKIESFSIFLSGLDPKLSKANIYEALAQFEGEKKVLASQLNRTAHLMLSSRQVAISVSKMLSDEQKLKKFGPEAELQLMTDIKLHESEICDLEENKYQQKLKEANYIVDADKARKLLEMIIEVKVPVVLESHLMSYGTSIDIFFGRNPPLKFDVTPETVSDFGIGKLIASPEVPKIVGRVDTNSIQGVLKACATRNFIPENFFDVSTGHKVIDYLQYGQSIFKSLSPGVKDISYKLGISGQTHFEQFLYIYIHLQQILPQNMLDFLAKKCRADLDIGSNINLTEAKELKRQLRMQYDTLAVHIRADSTEEIPNFNKVLTSFLTENKFSFSNVTTWGNRAVVCLNHFQDTEPLIKKIQKQKIKMSASRVDLKNPEKIVSENVSQSSLILMQRPFIVNLQKLGFFDIQNSLDSS